MSFVNKPGKTTTSRKMIIRQQVSDLFSFGKLVTTLTKAKETQRHAERLLTIAKANNLPCIRRICAFVLPTKNDDVQKLLKKILEYGQKYKDRKGGYTRVLKLDQRLGDNTQEAIIAFV
jgi:large subunit ribosomal protein L17